MRRSPARSALDAVPIQQEALSWGAAVLGSARPVGETRPMTSNDAAHPRPAHDFVPNRPDFRWGTATAAFQIEGDAAGRGDSIWDEMCRQPGRIADGSNGLVACDHVHRYVEDVALMSELGADAYRFSISWPRVQPGGQGPLAAAGVGFYDRLVDELLGAGIEPWATLYHWDLPLELAGPAGGWTNRDVVDRFTEYTLAIHSALGDRVQHWLTLNEPWCSSWLGYGSGEHAPGDTDHVAAARAAHHLLLAHGTAVRALRAQAPADHRLGIVLNLANVHPAVGREDDEAVAAAVRTVDGTLNRWWLDSLFTGRYPADMLEVFSPGLDGYIQDDDLATIATPIDVLGINYYNDHFVDLDGPPERTMSRAYPVAAQFTSVDPGATATGIGWPVTPYGLTDILLRVGNEYPTAPPLAVTENGSAYPDAATAPADGSPVEDPERVAYLRAHLEALETARQKGADVQAYFAWSLIDNFEWAWGYAQRFGIVHVDLETQERRPKLSYLAYRDHIAQVAKNLGKQK
jgi:beta-glucosidase